MFGKSFAFKKYAAFTAAALLLAWVCAAPAQAAQASMEDLFWRRAWPAMERLYASRGEKTARDHALMANAYRFRGKWPEAVAILEEHASSFPASIRPYAEMTLLLGYEELKKNQQALDLSERLWKNAPQDLKYYIALAQYRLTKDTSQSRAERALGRMLQNADTDDRRIYTLSRLIRLPGDRTDQALKLLNLQASNKAAAEVLAKHKSPTTAMRAALGIYAHLAGDNKGAEEHLRSVPLTAENGRRAAYYRAWSLSRLKRNSEALTVWGTLAFQGNAYAESAVRRLEALAKDKGMKDPCMKALERVARERRGKVQARALLSLSTLIGKETKENAARKRALEDELLQGYPDTAFDVLWRRGGASMRAGNAAEAARLWKQADAPGVGSYRRARILYWLSTAQRAAGNTAEADRNLALLKRKYPLTLYSFLAGGSVKIVDGENPALVGKQSELERWGFVLYARLRLQRPKAPARDLYRALRLARWLGLEDTYDQARRIESMLTAGPTLYRTDLESLYPRPYRAQVEAACKEYGVEAALVWSVMRQESAFKPRAKSSAGATGLMQLMPGTAKGEAKRMGLKQYDIYDTGDNIRMGTSHLSWLAKSFARADWVMAAYNAGSGNARKWLQDGRDKMALDRWIEEVRFSETCGYVQRVSANLHVYRLLYEKKGEAPAGEPAIGDELERSPQEPDPETVE